MSSIRYQSFSPKREVTFTPRAEGQDPTASVEIGQERALAAFKADLLSTDSEHGLFLPSYIKKIEVKGLAADVVADMWERYNALRTAVAESEDSKMEWPAWAAGKLAVRGAVEAPASVQRKWLLTELASQETGLKQQYGAEHAHLHPVAQAMRNFMYGQEQLGSLNGSTPNRELLPEAVFADPIKLMGMIALDLAEMPAPEPVEAS